MSTRLQHDETLQEDENLLYHLTQLGEALRNAMETCNSIRTTGLLGAIKNFVFSKGKKEKLDKAHRSMSRAMDHILFALSNNTNYLVSTTQQNQPPNSKVPVFNLDGDPPNAVRSLSVSVSGTYAVIRWKDTENVNVPGKVTQYGIHVEDESGRKVPVQNVTAPATSAAIELDGWKTYSIQVCAVNGHGNSSLSSPACTVYMNQSPPTKPSNLVWNVRTHNSIAVTVKEPQKFEEQGITHCIV